MKFIDDDSERPDINLVVVRLFRDDLRCDVKWSSLERVKTDGCGGHLTSKAEVTELNDAVSNEDVLGFQVAMHNSVVVEIEQSRNNLADVVLDFLELEPALLLQDDR